MAKSRSILEMPTKTWNQMKGTLRVVFIGACVALAAIWIVIGLVSLVEVRRSRLEQDTLARELVTTNGRVAELERAVRRVAAAQADAATGRKTSDASLMKSFVSLNDSEIQLVRQFIKVAPRQPNAQGGLKVGDALPQSTSLPMPQALVDKLPKLEGARFAIDPMGSIAISGAGEDRVAVIIPGPSLPAAN